jgi:hypothetical protein
MPSLLKQNPEAKIVLSVQRSSNNWLFIFFNETTFLTLNQGLAKRFQFFFFLFQ